MTAPVFVPACVMEIGTARVTVTDGNGGRDVHTYVVERAAEFDGAASLAASEIADALADGYDAATKGWDGYGSDRPLHFVFEFDAGDHATTYGQAYRRFTDDGMAAADACVKALAKAAGR